MERFLPTRLDMIQSDDNLNQKLEISESKKNKKKLPLQIIKEINPKIIARLNKAKIESLEDLIECDMPTLIKIIEGKKNRKKLEKVKKALNKIRDLISRGHDDIKINVVAPNEKISF